MIAGGTEAALTTVISVALLPGLSREDFLQDVNKNNTRAVRMIEPFIK
jgi:hypothetical protein